MTREYKVVFGDGHVGTMLIVDDKASPANEIAKWPQSEQDRVVSIEQIAKRSVKRS